MTRATFSGFTTALSALQANQKRLDITGQNLANMTTPGYTRQQLQVSSMNYSNPVSHYMDSNSVVVGFGTRMDSVAQLRDPYLDGQYRAQMAKSGYSDALQTSLDSLANVLDETTISGIQQAFKDIQSTLMSMQDPSKVNDPVYESELRSRMEALTDLLNDASRQIGQYKEQEYIRLDGDGSSENGAVQQVNDILRQIGELNRQIKRNQIVGQDSLELMDERNLLLDELASYIPIEVTYYKDEDHDGRDNADPNKEAPHEIYEYDAAQNIIGKKEWPDDLKVEMVYVDGQGTTQRLTLVDGTMGSGSENYGQLEIANGGKDNPDGTTIRFTAPDGSAVPGTANTPNITISANDQEDHFLKGSIQAGIDMLGKTGNLAAPDQGLDDMRGYQYYERQLDQLASFFADQMNTLNTTGNGGANSPLLASRDGQPITASNIGISSEWVSGAVHIGTVGDSTNETILNMLKVMNDSHTELQGKSFSDFMNNMSALLANDSSANQTTLKNNVTVLNSIQNSRDSISGVSLDEEASNMMAYISAYNAASRLMTTMDEALDKLINGTGTVGR